MNMHCKMTPFFKHAAITVADMKENYGYHLSRLSAPVTGRRDCIPVVDASLPGANQILCTLVSIPSLYRTEAERDALDELMYSHYQNLSSERIWLPGYSPAMLADTAWKKRLNLVQGDSVTDYLYVLGHGYLGAVRVYSADSQLDHLLERPRYERRLPDAERTDALRLRYGSDIRPDDVIAAYA